MILDNSTIIIIVVCRIICKFISKIHTTQLNKLIYDAAIKIVLFTQFTNITQINNIFYIMNMIQSLLKFYNVLIVH